MCEVEIVTYWYTVIHYATPEIIREGHHVTIEVVVRQMRRALEQGYEFRCGLD